MNDNNTSRRSIETHAAQAGARGGDAAARLAIEPIDTSFSFKNKGPRTGKVCSSSLSERAAAVSALSSGPTADALSGFVITATRVMCGASSLSSSIRLALSSGAKKLCPVMFPPGRDRLA